MSILSINMNNLSEANKISEIYDINKQVFEIYSKDSYALFGDESLCLKFIKQLYKNKKFYIMDLINANKNIPKDIELIIINGFTTFNEFKALENAKAINIIKNILSLKNKYNCAIIFYFPESIQPYTFSHKSTMIFHNINNTFHIKESKEGLSVREYLNTFPTTFLFTQ